MYRNLNNVKLNIIISYNKNNLIIILNVLLLKILGSP